MDRRAFLSLGLVVPFALKSGLAFANLSYEPDGAISVSFAADPKKPKMTLWQTPRQSPSQMMGYVLRTENGQTIVFDGGMKADGPYLTELLQKECDGKVDAWFMTHAHIDHCGALCQILEENPDAVKVEKLFYNFPSREWLDEYEPICKGESAAIFAGLPLYKGETRAAEPGEKFQFGPVSIETLNDFDPEIHRNAINNSSITFRIEVAGKSILILGDLGVEGGERLLKLRPDAVDCDFVQMAHHGQNGVNKAFYEAASPSVCLWPTPDWLWDNNSGKGPNSGPWKTLETRAWTKELGITEHYVSKDGLIKLTF